MSDALGPVEGDGKSRKRCRVRDAVLERDGGSTNSRGTEVICDDDEEGLLWLRSGWQSEDDRGTGDERLVVVIRWRRISIPYREVSG